MQLEVVVTAQGFRQTFTRWLSQILHSLRSLGVLLKPSQNGFAALQSGMLLRLVLALRPYLQEFGCFGFGLRRLSVSEFLGDSPESSGLHPTDCTQPLLPLTHHLQSLTAWEPVSAAMNSAGIIAMLSYIIVYHTTS